MKLIIFLLLLTSCSHRPAEQGVSYIASTSGLMKNSSAPFPVYLTDTLVSRSEIEKKNPSDVFIIHTGHILKPNLSKVENEKTLESLSSMGINLINLTLEDFIIADAEGINLESYNQTFLNSSVIDLNTDALVTGKNIVSYDPHEEIAFVGLSDNKFDSKFSKERFIISDHVLSILKVKRAALYPDSKTSSTSKIHSFILVHSLGNEINEVMTRLPPSFINSLAD